MPFPFVYVCDLLDELERFHSGDFPRLPKAVREYTNRAVFKWFERHNRNLGDFEHNSSAAVSMLRPDLLTDREYGLDAESLQQIIGRVLQLRQDDYLKLGRWQKNIHVCDLGQCAAEIVGKRQITAAPSKKSRVTVEEIDQGLKRIASSNSLSSPAIQSLPKLKADEDIITVLATLYERVSGSEAKWLTRFILKDYGLVKIPDELEIQSSGTTFLNRFGTARATLFSSTAPVPTYTEGTKIIVGVGSTAPPSLTHATSAPTILQQTSRDPAQVRGVWATSPIIPAKRRVSTPADIDSQGSQGSDPKPLSRGLLIPMRSITAPKPLNALPTTSHPAHSTKKSVPPISAATDPEISRPEPAISTRHSKSMSKVAVESAPQADGPVLSSYRYQLGILKPSNTNSASPIVLKSPLDQVTHSSMQVHARSLPLPKSQSIQTLNTTHSRLPRTQGSTAPLVQSSIKRPVAYSTRVGISTLGFSADNPLYLSDSEPEAASSSWALPSSAASKDLIPSSMTSIASLVLPPSSLSKENSSVTPRSPLRSLTSNAMLRSNILSLSLNPPQSLLQQAGSGSCRLTSSTCPLERCVFILAPSITDSTRILSELLPWHGSFYITDSSSLSNPDFPDHCLTTRKLYRKIVLVDPRKHKDTIDFLETIHALKLVTKVKRHWSDHGKGRVWEKEYLEVYDWKLLECVAKVDRGQDMNYDPWKRCWLMTV